MIIKASFYCISLLLLSGCSSGTDKIVDLSAVVFFLYVILAGMKYVSPMLVESSFFSNSVTFIQKHLKSVVIPIYVIALLLIFVGFYLNGIDRVFIFIGFSLAIIAYHLNRLAHTDQVEKRELSIEIVSLGIGIVLVQIMLRHYGADLFEPF